MFPASRSLPRGHPDRRSRQANRLPARFQASRPPIGSSSAHLNAQFRLTVHLGQVILENRLGHVDRSKDIGNQTDNQSDGKAANGTGAEETQKGGGNDRRSEEHTSELQSR